jgi:hypothetical protein
MNGLTSAEAIDLIEVTWNLDWPSHKEPYGFEVVLADMTERQAESDIASYLATLDRNIDPESIKVTSDDGDSGIPMTVVRIYTEGPT